MDLPGGHMDKQQLLELVLKQEEQLEKRKSEIQNISHKAQFLEQEIKAQKQKVSDLNHQKKDIEKQNQILNNNKNSLVLENKSLEQQNKVLEKSNRGIEKLNQDLRIDKQSLKKLSQSLSRDKQELKEDKKNLLEKIQKFGQNQEQLLGEKQKLEKQIQDILQKFSSMKFELAQLKRMIYGSKRERFISNKDDGQLSLPFEVPAEVIDQEPLGEKIEYTRKKRDNKNHKGRIALPDHLPVNEIILEPDQDTKGLKFIGNEVKDELEYVPSKLLINRYIRPKFAKLNNEGIIVADLPLFPLSKCIAGPGLLSQVHVDKFVDHLPYYRQIMRYAREGVKICQSTIDGWQTATYNLLYPLHETLRRQALGQGYLQVDETPIKVLDRRKKGKCHTGYHWVYYSPLERMVLFDYRDSRAREGPKELLKDFKGYLQTDGYNVYDWFGNKKDITLLNCMAHTRRYFDKALADDKKRAGYVMEEIQKLYKIERKARDLNMTPNQRHQLRLDESLTILNDLGKYMLEQLRTTLPKSPFGKALIYSLSRWDNLMAYLKDGHLEIDNNLVENSIRPTAIGRKNYLFAGSHNGAKKAAMFYSFFGTCKLNDVNPYKWLKKVLEIINEYPANKLSDLLPQNLKLEL